MIKTFRDNCDINIVQQTSCKPPFPDVEMQLKTYFFVPFVHPCMHHNYGVISGSCKQRLCVAYNFGCRALYNLPWRVSVSSHQVQCNIPTFEALIRKYKYLFLERCRKSNYYGYMLWCSQIVCTRHYSLITIIAFYSVNEWSNFAVSVWSMACQATMLSHFT